MGLPKTLTGSLFGFYVRAGIGSYVRAGIGSYVRAGIGSYVRAGIGGYGFQILGLTFWLGNSSKSKIVTK